VLQRIIVYDAAAAGCRRASKRVRGGEPKLAGWFACKFCSSCLLHESLLCMMYGLSLKSCLVCWCFKTCAFHVFGLTFWGCSTAAEPTGLTSGSLCGTVSNLWTLLLQQFQHTGCMAVSLYSYSCREFCSCPWLYTRSLLHPWACCSSVPQTPCAGTMCVLVPRIS
jgi:hypothetical protein